MKGTLDEFDEFNYEGYTVTLDLGSAFFDGGRIHVQGSATGDGDKLDVTASFEPQGVDLDTLSEEPDPTTPVELLGVEEVSSATQL